MKMAVLAGARPPINPAWHAQWVDIMRACWSLDAAKRPTFAALEEMLSRLVEQHATGSAQQSAPVAHPDASTVHQLVQQAANAMPPTVMASPMPQQQQPQMAAALRQMHAPTPPGGQYPLAMHSPRGVPPTQMAPPPQNSPHPSQQAKQPATPGSSLPAAAHQHPQQPSPPGVRQVTQQVAGTKLSPGMKTMAGPQFGGIVHDMEEM
jgi:hypothetical protein